MLSWHVGMQVQLFRELHAAELNASNSGAESDMLGPVPVQNLFATPEDRLFLMSILLHTADISNPTKPQGISDKCGCICQQCLAAHTHAS